MASDYVFIPYRQLLTKEQLETITGDAARLYTVAWNRMAFRKTAVVMLSNAEVTDRGRIGADALQAAQNDLCRHGLLEIEQLANDWARYAFVYD